MRLARCCEFFLATFGEGITNLYLRPYNEKIWKFDPAFMDTQMVDRIPKPPADDIIRSAKGDASEGYLHQLYFYYPKRGGVQSLFDAFLRRLTGKVAVHVNAGIERVERDGAAWRVATADGASREFDLVVSTIPIPELICRLQPAVPQHVAAAARDLKFNSIAICMVHVRQDRLGDNFAVMVPDRDIIFHRLSKLDFLLPPEDQGGGSRIMAEVTYRGTSPHGADERRRVAGPRGCRLGPAEVHRWPGRRVRPRGLAAALRLRHLRLEPPSQRGNGQEALRGRTWHPAARAASASSITSTWTP